MAKTLQPCSYGSALLVVKEMRHFLDAQQSKTVTVKPTNVKKKNGAISSNKLSQQHSLKLRQAKELKSVCAVKAAILQYFTPVFFMRLLLHSEVLHV